MKSRKDDPSYLLRLGRQEALALIPELNRMDPNGLAEGRTLSVDQYHFLLNQISDRLRKTNKLPVRPLDRERFQAFEQPFWQTLHNAGLV